ncbi:MAG: tRNA pseudouridine(55) synthase TruB [Rhodospirillales bacterium]
MARKRKGDPVHGWLVIDKPQGMTSSQVVGKVRWLLGAQKAGHGGTLDPMATGLLPVAFGEATKTVSWAMDGRKAYRAAIRWGEERDTCDAEGDVTETSDVRPRTAEVEAAFPAFTGEIEQAPPAYSAIKINGRRAYDLARGGEAPEMLPRTVTIEALSLVETPDADHAVIDVVCGKGTYIRSLARDLARHLGTVGHLAALRRTAVGSFSEEHKISLDNLDALGHIPARREALLPVETVLDDIPALALTEQEAQSLRHGQPISAEEVARRSPLTDVHESQVSCAFLDERLVALVRLVGGEIRPLRVLNM